MPSSSGPRWQMTSVMARTAEGCAWSLRSTNPAIPHIVFQSYHSAERRLLALHPGLKAGLTTSTPGPGARERIRARMLTACDNRTSTRLMAPGSFIFHYDRELYRHAAARGRSRQQATI